MPTGQLQVQTPSRGTWRKEFFWKFWCLFAQRCRLGALDTSTSDIKKTISDSFSYRVPLERNCFGGVCWDNVRLRTLQNASEEKNVCTSRSFSTTVGESRAIWSNWPGAWPKSSVESSSVRPLPLWRFLGGNPWVQTLSGSKKSKSIGEISWLFRDRKAPCDCLRAPPPATLFGRLGRQRSPRRSPPPRAPHSTALVEKIKNLHRRWFHSLLRSLGTVRFHLCHCASSGAFNFAPPSWHENSFYFQRWSISRDRLCSGLEHHTTWRGRAGANVF